jgi:hypothetical protein
MDLSVQSSFKQIMKSIFGQGLTAMELRSRMQIGLGFTSGLKVVTSIGDGILFVKLVSVCVLINDVASFDAFPGGLPFSTVKINVINLNRQSKLCKSRLFCMKLRNCKF